MSLRDLLLVAGTLPLVGVVALRLAAEVGLVRNAPPPEAVNATLGLFGVVFVLYVALTLRAIARATREILERSAEPVANETEQRTAAVTDFAVHLDRRPEIDLRGDAGAEDAAPSSEEAAAPPPEQRSALLGQVGSLLTRIPSARSR
ncbi:MAG TPA: hypothetical protein VIS07_09190 [Candidatus Binatia bacterium]